MNGGSKQEEKARQKQRTLHDAVGVSLWNIILLTYGVGVYCLLSLKVKKVLSFVELGEPPIT